MVVSGSSRDPAWVPQTWPSSLYPCVPDFHHVVSSASVAALGHGEWGTVILVSAYFVLNVAKIKIIRLLYQEIMWEKKWCAQNQTIIFCKSILQWSLLLQWAKLGVNLSNFPVSLSAIVFHVGLAGKWYKHAFMFILHSLNLYEYILSGSQLSYWNTVRYLCILLPT